MDVDKSWRINKEIPVIGIAAWILTAFAGVWYASELYARVQQLDNTQQAIQVQISTLNEKQSDLREQIGRIEGKME